MKPTAAQLLKRAMEIVRDSEEYLGLCLACGAEQDSCEPDACQYVCEQCGAPKVYGAEEIIFMGGAE
jgi:hypothetical protein